MANLFRPQNQTRAAVTAVGFGVFVMGTVILVDRNVRMSLSVTALEIEANVAVFDIPPDRSGDLAALLADAGHPALDILPVIPARLHAVEGVLVADLLEQAGRRGRRGQTIDTAAARQRPQAWALRREYRNSIRDTLVRGETVVQGEWWDGSPEADGPTRAETTADGPLRLSLDDDVARALRVEVGDRITWDMQGRSVESEVANLREVDWSRLAPNFIALFEPGPADGLPRTDLVLTRIDEAAARAAFQDRVVRTIPGALVLDLAGVQAIIERVLDRASLATRFMGTFTLVAGLLILAATIIAARGLRARENALLRALGADARTLRGILTIEFLALGALAGLAGVALASAASWALLRSLFGLSFTLPWGSLALLWSAAVLLTLALGALGSRATTRPSALAALRRAEAIG